MNPDFTYVTPGHARDISGDLLERYESRLRPGGCSSVGFMGPDERLRQIVQEDDATLAGLHITYRQVADKLYALVEKAKFIFSERQVLGPIEQVLDPIVVDKKFEVSGVGLCTNGFQKCPFDETNSCGSYRQDITIANLSTQDKISFSSLHIHLYSMHQFCEGKGSPFRLAPEAACKVLELEPGVDYSKELVYRDKKKVWGYWGKVNYEEKISQEHLQKLEKEQASSFQINDDTTAYVMHTADIATETGQIPSRDLTNSTFLHVVCRNGDIPYEERSRSVHILGADYPLMYLVQGITVCPLQIEREVVL